MPPSLGSFSQIDTNRASHENENVASRLKIVLDAIDNAGFDSMESMAVAYYSSNFPAGSPVKSAQSISKKRHIRKLLTALHQSSKTWDVQEVQGYREGIMRSAEDIIIEDMQSLKLDATKIDRNGSLILERLESILVGHEAHEMIKENKRNFKEYVSIPS